MHDTIITPTARTAKPNDQGEWKLLFRLAVAIIRAENCRMLWQIALRKTTTEFLLHYHGERPHQGLGHRILQPGPEVGQKEGTLVCQERLGGLLRYYYRQAA
jgi:hypothetical protein